MDKLEVAIGDESDAAEIAGKLLEAGFFVNVAVFPAVPRRRAGLRFMLGAAQALSDIEALAREIGRLLRARGGRRRSMARAR